MNFSQKELVVRCLGEKLYVRYATLLTTFSCKKVAKKSFEILMERLTRIGNVEYEALDTKNGFDARKLIGNFIKTENPHISQGKLLMKQILADLPYKKYC